jgi:tetratricopeptide (TPR) repeat protein
LEFVLFVEATAGSEKMWRMERNSTRNCALILGVWLITNCGTACAQQPTWQDEQREAIAVTEKDPAAAIKLYRSAIKDAAAANAPIEKQLGLILECGNLLWGNWNAIEAKEVFSQGIELAHNNGLKNWEARFLLMSSCNAHELFQLGLSTDNDPAPAVKALELRPGNPDCPTDFHINCLQAIGNAYLDRKDYTNAEKYLYDAIAEAERMPDAQYRANEIIQSFLQMRINQKKYADATRLLVESCDSQPIDAMENKGYYFGELNWADPETATINATVKNLLKQTDYAGLDSYAAKLRLTDAPTADGELPINYFLGRINLKEYQPEIEWKNRLDSISNWVKQRPNSDTAKIALADLLTGYAWKARGSGWADSVTKEGWKLMQERLAQALEILRQVKQRTPDWYSVSQHVALGQSWDRTQYENLVNECHTRYPQYRTVIFKKAYWLQPKWYGHEDEATKYINAEANRLPGLAGDVLYAQIAWSLDFSFGNVITDAHLDWPRTKRGLKEIIRLHPDSLRARGELAFLAERAGDKATQLSAFQQQGNVDSRIKMNPKGYSIAFEQGILLQKDDKREEAIAAYSKAIELAPKNGEAYYRRCEMYLMTNKLAQAYSDIEKCLAMFPEWLPAISERGRLENRIEKYPESISDLERELSFKPNSGSALSTLGHDYDALGNHQRALDVANFAVEVTEQGDPGNLYYDLQDRGLAWSNAHQYDNAVGDLRKGISLNEKRSSQLWAYLAYVDAATDRIDQAKEDAKKLFERETYAPRGFRLRAEMLRAAGLWEESIVDYSQSITSEPGYGPGYWQRAVSEIALGNYESAESDLKKSVSLVPTSALAISYLAFVEDLLGKSIDSKNNLAKAFVLTPNLPMNYVNRARIHLHHGELESAAADCDMALKLDNYLADAYATSALVLAKAGKNEAAVKFDAEAKRQWWHPWKVPIDTPKESKPSDVSITMPTLGVLKPQAFSVAVRDCAP